MRRRSDCTRKEKRRAALAICLESRARAASAGAPACSRLCAGNDTRPSFRKNAPARSRFGNQYVYSGVIPSPLLLTRIFARPACPARPYTVPPFALAAFQDCRRRMVELPRPSPQGCHLNSRRCNLRKASAQSPVHPGRGGTAPPQLGARSHGKVVRPLQGRDPQWDASSVGCTYGYSCSSPPGLAEVVRMWKLEAKIRVRCSVPGRSNAGT